MKTTLAVFSMLFVLARVAGADVLVDRGAYLVGIMDCTGCHTTGALLGQPDPARFLAGSNVGFGGPPPEGASSGPVIYPPNLTPDIETGLGAWSDEEIIRAFKTGVSRDGRRLAPMMPWPSYARISDDDAHAVVAYLRSLAPVKHKPPANVAPGEKPAAPYLTLVVPN